MTRVSSSSDYAHLLGDSGPVAARIQGFIHRQQQIDMATMIADTMEAGDNAMIEAGTGTGKTFAYLLPLLLSRQRGIISTGSKTLQDQLFYQDLPLIADVLDWPVKVALLKGRGNYLCPQRLEKHIATATRYSDAAHLPELIDIRGWWQRTTTGDLNELVDLEGSSVLPLITSTVDNCLGGDCPMVSECPLYKARARAQVADVVVVNHHLLFADLALKEEGFASLLPDVSTVVVDEAHQIVEVARHFFGERVSSGQINALCRDIRAENALLGNDDIALTQAAEALESVLRELTAQLRKAPAEFELDSILSLPGPARAIDHVDLALGELLSVLAGAAVRSTVLGHCYSRALRQADEFSLLTEVSDRDSEFIHWLERLDHGFVLHLSPISIAKALQAQLDASRTWILTSATLSVGREFTHFKRALGNSNFNEQIFDSPFQFIDQVKAHVPQDIPAPGSDHHTRALVNYCLPLIQQHRGRTFFLFTSYRAMHVARDILEGYAGLPILVQGSMAKAQLLAKFREISGCILLATHSFWEGVDVRGADLRCLIIDKLPFSSPDDPMTAAQLKLIGAAGGNPFIDHAVPEAVIALKQGFGRLIRQESDRGLFVLGDTRLVTRAYGKLFINSLPEMEWLQSREAVTLYLDDLNK
ncbi:MAG: ATP-dependent DNA helicase DinG [Candidatus Pseudothioglobus sp.]|jgi:ATP-dependent DNA helicase DinG